MENKATVGKLQHLKFKIEVKFNVGFDLQGRAYNNQNFYHFLYDMICLKNKSWTRCYVGKFEQFIVICEENWVMLENLNSFPMYDFIHMSAMPCAIVWIETSNAYVYSHAYSIYVRAKFNLYFANKSWYSQQRQWSFITK